MNNDELFTKELFFNQMNDFENSTSKDIIELLNDKEYILEVEILGLVATARALALIYSENDDSRKAILDTAAHMLQRGKDE